MSDIADDVFNEGQFKIMAAPIKLRRHKTEKEKAMAELVVYLRLIDAGTDNACWFVCAKGDHGAIPFQVKH